MLKELNIRNFRSHENTKLEFSTGINCIIGNPDSGKTNILRSLAWLLTNRPLGIRMQSDTTTEDVVVKLEFDNGSWVSLSKNKKWSKYSTYLDEELKAIGSDVPDVISSIANMSELNMQRQLDKPFLICSSPSEVAKLFNRITKLEKIDKAVSLLTTDINSENKRIKILESQALELSEKIEEMGDLKEMAEDNEDIQELEEKETKLADKSNRLQSLLTLIDLEEKKIKGFELLHQMEIDSKAAEAIFKEWSVADADTEDFEELLKDLKMYGDRLLKSGDTINNIQGEYTTLDALQTVFDSGEDDYNNLEDTIEEISIVGNRVEQRKQALDAKVKEYKLFLKNIDVCPFCDACNTPIEEHDFNLFLKEFQ